MASANGFVEPRRRHPADRHQVLSDLEGDEALVWRGLIDREFRLIERVEILEEGVVVELIWWIRTIDSGANRARGEAADAVRADDDVSEKALRAIASARLVAFHTDRAPILPENPAGGEAFAHGHTRERARMIEQRLVDERARCDVAIVTTADGQQVSRNGSVRPNLAHTANLGQAETVYHDTRADAIEHTQRITIHHRSRDGVAWQCRLIEDERAEARSRETSRPHRARDTTADHDRVEITLWHYGVSR